MSFFGLFKSLTEKYDDLLAECQDLTEWEKVETVNEWVNWAIDYHREPPGRDNWQTPMESLKLGHGDCEDISILKMDALVKLGIDPKNARCCYVKYDPDITSNYVPVEAHMVLYYFVTLRHAPFILDNLTHEVLQNRADLSEPLYQFNFNGRWTKGRKGWRYAKGPGNWSKLKGLYERWEYDL